MGAPRLVLRPLTETEEQTLGERLGEKRLPAKVYERYRLITVVRGGTTPSAASRVVGCSDGKAEHWVHRFNASGFTTFEKQPNHPGRPIIIDGEQVRALIRVALSRPEDLGLPFTQWSVSKLRAYCLKKELIPPISDEWVRRLLRREGLSYQHTKTWKESNDPEFEAKKPRPRPLPGGSRGRGGRLLRRVWPARTEAAARPVLGEETPSSALPCNLSPSSGHGATPRLLRRPCRLLRRPSTQAQDCQGSRRCLRESARLLSHDGPALRRHG